MEKVRTTPSFPRLMVFILKTRTRLIFSGADNTMLNIGRIILVLVLAMYSILTGLLLMVSDPDDQLFYSLLILSSIPAIIVSSGIFPVLKLPSNVVPGYAPLPGKQTGLLNLVYNLFRPGTIYGLLFLGIITTITYPLGPWLFLNGMMLLVATSALDFGIKQTILSAQTRGIRGLKLMITAGIINFAGLLLFFLMYYFGMLGADHVYSLYLLLFTVSCVVYYMYTIELTETATSTSIFSNSSVGSASLRSLPAASRLAYGRKHSTKPMYILIPSFNAMIGIYLYYFAEGNMAEVFALMLAFPLLPFTYVHNNFWGFFRESWLAVRLSPATNDGRWKLFTGALWLPLSLDAVSSFAALWFSGEFRPYHISLYFLLVPPVMLLSYWSSLRFPRKVNALLSINQMTSFKNNTSGISSFVIILFCYATSFLIALSYNLAAIIMVCSISAMAWYFIRDAERKQHYRISMELFK